MNCTYCSSSQESRALVATFLLAPSNIFKRENYCVDRMYRKLYFNQSLIPWKRLSVTHSGATHKGGTTTWSVHLHTESTPPYEPPPPPSPAKEMSSSSMLLASRSENGVTAFGRKGGKCVVCYGFRASSLHEELLATARTINC